jgi:hypothetical protein
VIRRLCHVPIMPRTGIGGSRLCRGLTAWAAGRCGGRTQALRLPSRPTAPDTREIVCEYCSPSICQSFIDLESAMHPRQGHWRIPGQAPEVVSEARAALEGSQACQGTRGGGLRNKSLELLERAVWIYPAHEETPEIQTGWISSANIFSPQARLDSSGDPGDNNRIVAAFQPRSCTCRRTKRLAGGVEGVIQGPRPGAGWVRVWPIHEP